MHDRLLDRIEIRRRPGSVREDAAPVRESADIADIVGPLLADETIEVFLAVFLDIRHRPLGYHEVSRGTLTESLVHPREVFRAAIAIGAARIAVAHNHPSGDPTPSGTDIETTRRLVAAGDLLGIPLVDHIIVGEVSGKTIHVSLRESGLWPE